ncbi:unnamed protein product [Bathycoccus prasinos]
MALIIVFFPIHAPKIPPDPRRISQCNELVLILVQAETYYVLEYELIPVQVEGCGGCGGIDLFSNDNQAYNKSFKRRVRKGKGRTCLEPAQLVYEEKNFGIASEPWGNVGQEITSYMRFILLFWDHLPERVAFVHGHDKTWHQEGYKMSYILRNICLDKYEYISLSAYESEDAWRPLKGSRSYFEIIKKNWYLVKPYLGRLPKSGFREKCCAQFMVSRERIRKQPRELYEVILKQMSDKRKNYHRAPHGKNLGWDLIHFWEAIWHYIMGEGAIVNTKKKYGYSVDNDIETGQRLNKRPERTLKNVIACPHITNG